MPKIFFKVARLRDRFEEPQQIKRSLLIWYTLYFIDENIVYALEDSGILMDKIND